MINDSTNFIVLPTVALAVALAVSSMVVIVMAMIAAQRHRAGLLFSHDMKMAASRETRKPSPVPVRSRAVRRAA
jgi:hypothetical protein